uniref:Uncharacterized protein n=1 Tax=Anguilla anguilla TaxID=7936 RepID=A0A0E9PAX4_ANGAN
MYRQIERLTFNQGERAIESKALFYNGVLRIQRCGKHTMTITQIKRAHTQSFFLKMPLRDWSHCEL